ncbi:MAG: site-2 protease family protein [Kofleriaceae bacterium]
MAFHEFGHAFVADRLGDDTPSRQGRVTLNPLAHADPIGTFLLPLMSAVYTGGAGGGFGWGRPVETNPVRYTRRFSMATGQVFVAIAGPGMNLLLAILLAIAHLVLVRQQVIEGRSDVSEIFLKAVSLNFTLMFFNLLPVPPLDGGWVARRFVPRQYARVFESISTYGVFILIAFIAIPQLSRVITVPASFCMQQLYRGLYALLF